MARPALPAGSIEDPVSQLVDGLAALVERQLHRPVTAAGPVCADEPVGAGLSVDHLGDGGFGGPTAGFLTRRRHDGVVLVLRRRLGGLLPALPAAAGQFFEKIEHGTSGTLVAGNGRRRNGAAIRTRRGTGRPCCLPPGAGNRAAIIGE